MHMKNIDYKGYLRPYLTDIKHCLNRGMSNGDIARRLMLFGVKPSCYSNTAEQTLEGLVNYIRNRFEERDNPKPKRQTILIYQSRVWTPETTDEETQKFYGYEVKS